MEPLINSMMAALALLRSEMQGEACRECRDLRKGGNTANRPQLSLENASPKGFGQKYALPVLLRSLCGDSMQPSRSAWAERIFGSNAAHQRINHRFLSI